MQLLAVHSCMSLKQLYNQFRFYKHLFGFVTEYQTSPAKKKKTTNPLAPLSFVGGLVEASLLRRLVFLLERLSKAKP